MVNGKTIFDSFNARYLSYRDVASSFIINDHFSKLIINNHSLLMGPRGCGKTTLLKMLTPPAIYKYDELNKTAFSGKIPFRSIYIPTDIQWKRQIETLEKTSLDNGIVLQISKSTMLVTILGAICNTFKTILQYELKIENISDIEIEISKDLITLWKIEGPIAPTFKSIEKYLLNLISELNAQINQAVLIGTPIVFNQLFFYNFLDLTRLACDSFIEKSKVANKKWALCFDELEIAPNWLQTELMSLLRSTDQQFLFKLTTAPIISIYKYASEGNDYNIIKIWTSDQNSLKAWNVFCNNLLERKVTERIQSIYRGDVKKDLFGDSHLDLTLKSLYPTQNFNYEVNEYQEDSPTWFAIKELAKQDATFERFLRRKHIDPLNPCPKSKHEEDVVFRKIKQLVIHRLHLKKDEKRLRTRKVDPLYYGVPTVFEFCDGNPRMLIGILNEFIDLAVRTDGSIKRLTINEQSRILTKVSEKHLLITVSHPDATILYRDKYYNLITLVDKIGHYIFYRSIIAPFKMDYVSTFKVDEDFPRLLIPLIEFALYSGIFVHLDDSVGIDENSILNKRLRLSYTLSPYYRLLPRISGEVNLSEIFSSTITSINLFENDFN